VVVVHYQGCEMRVLDRCSAPVAYQYAGMNRKKDRVAIHDADELYASVPAMGRQYVEDDNRRDPSSAHQQPRDLIQRNSTRGRSAMGVPATPTVMTESAGAVGATRVRV